MIDIAQVQGQVHAQSVQKVGELADQNPHETVAIIRNGCTKTPPEPCRTADAMAQPRKEKPPATRLQARRDARQPPGDNSRPRKLTGPERAAVLMLALGEQYGGKIWNLLDDDELRQISVVMSTLGTIEADSVENLLLEFVARMSASGALMGNYDATERLLQQYLPPDRVGGIMDEIRGPAGRNMWEKLSNVQEEVLANYLKNEYPQTVAVVLSKMRPSTPRECWRSCRKNSRSTSSTACCKMESVQKEVIERVEQTLRTEFMSNLSQTRRRDAHEVMAEIFNNFDRQTETRFLTSLEEDNREAAERIKALMFTFDDLIKLDTGSAQTLMRHVEKDKLAIALKGAAETVRQFFLSNMSTRAAKMLLDDMQAMGPVRLRDVDEAQALLVNLAKDLAAKGEIMISKSRADEEMIYWMAEARPPNISSTKTSAARRQGPVARQSRASSTTSRSRKPRRQATRRDLPPPLRKRRGCQPWRCRWRPAASAKSHGVSPKRKRGSKSRRAVESQPPSPASSRLNWSRANRSPKYRRWCANCLPHFRARRIWSCASTDQIYPEAREKLERIARGQRL